MAEKIKKVKKMKRPKTLLAKILLLLFSIVLIGVFAYFIYYLFHYQLYNRYHDFLTTYEVEDGRPYTPLNDSVNNVPGFELVAENDYLKLYTDPASAGIAVYDKRNGEIIYSNPPDAENDSIANNINIGYMKSQFMLTYLNRHVRFGNFDSYGDAVAKGQFSVESIENGVRYRYRIGDLPKVTTGTIPIYIHVEKLEYLGSKMSEREGRQFVRRYVSSDLGADIRQLSGPVLANNRTLLEMQNILDEIGWTEYDYLANLEEVGEVETTNVPISFDISLEYRLEGDAVKVSVPASKIKSYGGGTIFQIHLLRFMGAAHTSENGYFVVPNGSGALIDFNNGKQFYPIYQQSIYGMDPLAAVPIRSENVDTVKLPFFGICRENSSLLITVEEGKTIASISAAVSGTFNDYNYAFPIFTVSNVDNLLNFGSSNVDVFVREPDIYDINMTVRYSFLTEENKDYSGLANYYRDKLIREGKLTPTPEIAAVTQPMDIPFYYDIIGGVKETNHFLGVQYLRVFPMTTFANAKIMADELKEAGINKQVVNFQGWFNGGFYHNAPDRISLVRKLGSKSEFEKLSSKIEDDGGRFYADVALQHVTYADRRFNWKTVASRYYGLGFAAFEAQTCPCCLWAIASMGFSETFLALVSPKYLPRYVENFTDKIGRYEIAGISLRELSCWLHSDKRRTNIISREDALSVVLAQFDLLATTEKNLMGSGSFDYSFPYLTDIINAPLGANRFFIIDREIPLYQMIVHGSLSYGGTLLNYNYEEDKSRLILNHIEFGASPHYVFSWEEANKMKFTGLSRYFNTTFNVWKYEAIDIYHQINEALKYVNGALIINHQILDDVRVITYSNGVTIYINYGDEKALIDGHMIEPLSYHLK